MAGLINWQSYCQMDEQLDIWSIIRWYKAKIYVLVLLWNLPHDNKNYCTKRCVDISRCFKIQLCNWQRHCVLNTLRPRQNGRHFPDDIFKCIFLNENIWIPIENSLKIFPKGTIHNMPVLVWIMAWRRSGEKPLSDPMMISLLTHIYVAQPQWVNAVLAIKGSRIDCNLLHAKNHYCGLFHWANEERTINSFDWQLPVL